MAIPHEYGGVPVIGKDIPWKLIEKEACRIKHFTPLAKVEVDKVLAFSRGMPYALLRVESPKLPQEAVMPVVHRLDFKNLWEIFKQRGVGKEEEVLVFYVPFFGKGLKRFLSTGLPKLHLYIYPSGHLEEMYDSEFQPSDVRTWFQPTAVWRPKGYPL